MNGQLKWCEGEWTAGEAARFRYASRGSPFRKALGRALAVALVSVSLLIAPACTPSQHDEPLVAAGSTSEERVKPAAAIPPPATPAEPVWLPTLEEGRRRAREQGQPILVRFGAVWCVWCRRLDEQIAMPAVQIELKRWTCVEIDVDKSPDAAQQLGVGPIPALRVLSPTGRVIAGHEGYLDADALIAWLGEHHDSAKLALDSDLASDQPPTAETLPPLLAAFNHADPVTREAVIRRLAPHVRQAAPAVVEAFAEGDLGTRLTALELLREWRAPIEGIDPWQPDSIDETAIAAVREWAAALGTNAPAAEVGPPVLTAEVRPESESPAMVAAAAKDIAAGLDALLAAQGDLAVDAACERLVRLGQAVLPAIYERLDRAVGDAERERLTYARYRLAASEQRALEWREGLRRLASADVARRHAAAQELAAFAGRSDSKLLLELFSDPDPLVREISLTALRGVGGSETVAALVGLLKDPEPNVRAAVLKQLGESPSPKYADALSEYVAAEQDPDLLVHAARVLRGIQSEKSSESLESLLDHENWRVRAEATEALGEMVRRGNLQAPRRASAYAALIQRLEDDDGFVVSRAVTALSGVDLPAVVEPVTRAAANHPEIAGDALRLLAHPSLRSKALPLLRDFTRHADPEVRRAAVMALAETAPGEAGDAVVALLSDASVEVRVAAADAAFRVISGLNPGSSNVSRRSFVFISSSNSVSRTEGAPSAEWLEKFRRGEGRPEWLNQAVDPLRRMLGEESAEARGAAALMLAALGREEESLPVLRELAGKSDAHWSRAVAAVGWLVEPARGEFYESLRTSATGAQQLGELAASLTTGGAASTDLLWRLAETSSEADVAGTVHAGLRQAYFANHEDFTPLSPAAKRPIVEAAEPRTKEGPPYQRLVALALLFEADPKRAAKPADAMAADAALPASVREDAFRMLLLGEGGSAARDRAVKAIGGSDPAQRKLALQYLARGPYTLMQLSTAFIWLQPADGSIGSIIVSDRGGSPKPPAGLTPDSLRPLITDADGEVAALAGYELALLGSADGLPQLLNYWRDDAEGDPDWRRLSYQAIAALDDDTLTPTLQEIYESFGDSDWEVRQFYWTIRSLRGEQALKLRKKIRDEVGMERLR